MTHKDKSTSHHGVLMNIDGHGIFIIGLPGIGKSNFALELLHQGHQLIADDVVEFTCSANIITGSCPKMSAGFLHSRELGLIAISQLFGKEALQKHHALNYIVELKQTITNSSNLSPSHSYEILGVKFPLLQLSTNSTVSLYHRLITWLAMQSSDHDADSTLKHRQQQAMTPKQ